MAEEVKNNTDANNIYKDIPHGINLKLHKKKMHLIFLFMISLYAYAI